MQSSDETLCLAQRARPSLALEAGEPRSATATSHRQLRDNAAAATMETMVSCNHMPGPMLGPCPSVVEVTMGPNLGRQDIEPDHWEATIAFDVWKQHESVYFSFDGLTMPWIEVMDGSAEFDTVEYSPDTPWYPKDSPPLGKLTNRYNADALPKNRARTIAPPGAHLASHRRFGVALHPLAHPVTPTPRRQAAPTATTRTRA
eukprot:4523159-Prymnesium_polylepis.1